MWSNDVDWRPIVSKRPAAMTSLFSNTLVQAKLNKSSSTKMFSFFKAAQTFNFQLFLFLKQ